MEPEMLYQAGNLDISYDTKTCILFCKWKGRQTKDLIYRSGEVIYELFHNRKECYRVLNDNTDKIGEFAHSIEYTAKHWFPRMIDAGLLNFAWVFSQDVFTQLTAEKALPTEHLHVVKVFTSYQEAYDWLIKQTAF